MGTILDFMHEAGWPIFPVLGFGLAALAHAISYARRPVESTAVLVRGLGLVTFLLGIMGTLLGLEHALNYVGKIPLDQYPIFLKGLDETLNNMDAALFVLIPTALVYLVGAARAARLREDA